MHRVWAQLCGTERLGVSLDSCRFTPPWKVGHAEPGAIHWDHNPWNAAKRMFQGVLALTDTSIDQGGFCCVPSLYRNPDAWPDKPIIDEAGRGMVSKHKRMRDRPCAGTSWRFGRMGFTSPP